MSYNIDDCRYVSGKLSIQRQEARRLYNKYERRIELAESNFLEGIIDERGNPDDFVEISSPQWSGQFSGGNYDVLKEILSHTIGIASLVLVWEGGDRTTGLLVQNGVVREKKVKVELEG